MNTGMPNSLDDLSPRDRTLLESVLESLPDPVKSKFKEIFTSADPNALLLALLPSDFKETFDDLLTGRTLNEAQLLISQCRFFESRAHLRSFIESYEQLEALHHQKHMTSVVVLNEAVVSVTLRGRALLYELLGSVEFELGNIDEAGRCYELALNLAEQAGDNETTAKSLNGLGLYHFKKGELQQGFDLCSAALELIDQTADHWRNKKIFLNSLAVLLSDIGLGDLSLDYALQAVEACTEIEDAAALPLALNTLACLFFEAGSHDNALSVLSDAYDLCTPSVRPDTRALICSNLAFFLLNSDEQDQAEPLLQEAIDLAGSAGGLVQKAQRMMCQALLCQLRQDYRAAEAAFAEAAADFAKLGMRQQQAEALFALARQRADMLSDHEGAVAACSEAIAIIESIRGGLRREQHRIHFADKMAEPYAFIIACLLKLERPAEALAYVERAKSRALLELLSQPMQQNLNSRIGSDAGAHINSLMTEIDEIRKNLEAIYLKADTGSKADDESDRSGFEDLTEMLSRALSDKEVDLEKAYAGIEIFDRDVASLVHGAPCSLSDICACLGPDTRILSFYQTADCLHLFVLDHAGMVYRHTVPITAQDAAALVFDLHEALHDRTTHDLRSHDYLRRVRQPLEQLFAMLFAPLETFLEGCARLIITPHLFWHYLPFHALYDGRRKAYLCDSFEIGFAPSASVLSLCRAKKRTSRESAVILARDEGSLPFVLHEADMLGGCFYPCGRTFKQKEARLNRAFEQPAPDIVHIACHGEYNPEQPLLSGFDIPPDDSEDRRTYLSDLFSIQLPATLITLSACESGLCSYTSADELTGLSRGLFYAGAASVMLSLWHVADESTCTLMEQFYFQYIKNGLTKTRSLQLAMQAVRNNEKYRHPYYWAPFVVMGEWR